MEPAAFVGKIACCNTIDDIHRCRYTRYTVHDAHKPKIARISFKRCSSTSLALVLPAKV